MLAEAGLVLRPLLVAWRDGERVGPTGFMGVDALGGLDAKCDMLLDMLCAPAEPADLRSGPRVLGFLDGDGEELVAGDGGCSCSGCRADISAKGAL